MIKTFLKTTAAVATLIAGSQSWGATITLNHINSLDNTATGAHANVHTSQASGAIGVTVVSGTTVVKDNGTAPAGDAGGLVALDKELTIEATITATTYFEILALKDLDIFVRATTKGTAISAVTLSTIYAMPGVKKVRVWGSDITTLTASSCKFVASAKTDVSSFSSVLETGTKEKDGRTYTLVKSFIN